MNWAAIGDFFLKLAAKLAPFFIAFFAGKESQKNEQTEDNLKASRDAKNIKDRVDHDPAFRRDVRDKYR